MSPLAADTVYTYKAGSDAQGWTAAFSFNAAPASPVFAVLADYGLGNDESEAQLIADGKNGAFDIVIHAGDFAYDFDDSGSKTGNAFMNTLQPFAATHPYMVAPGNHEAFVLLATPDEKRSYSPRPACGRLCMLSLRPINPPHTSLSHHRYRLRYGTQGGGAFEQFALRYRAVRENAGANSGSPNNFWYSFETPLIHWIAFTAESWTMTPAQLAAQSAWLAADVAKVDRSVTPWVVAFSHKAWQMDSTTWSLFDWMAPAGVDFHFVSARELVHALAPATLFFLTPARSLAGGALASVHALPADRLAQWQGGRRLREHVRGQRDLHEPQVRSISQRLRPLPLRLIRTFSLFSPQVPDAHRHGRARRHRGQPGPLLGIVAGLLLRQLRRVRQALERSTRLRMRSLPLRQPL